MLHEHYEGKNVHGITILRMIHKLSHNLSGECIAGNFNYFIFTGIRCVFAGYLSFPGACCARGCAECRLSLGNAPGKF